MYCMSMWGKKKKQLDVEFDEIFLDSSNLPLFNQGRLEGRIELPITRRNVFVVGIIFALIALLFFWKLFSLQVLHGASYRAQSENNRIDEGVIVAERGVVYDRNGELLAWNEHDYTDEYDFPVRAYTDRRGLGQLVGYVSYPQKDSKGFYFRTEYLGRNGIEGTYHDLLSGINGRRLLEVDALSAVVSEHTVSPPTPGSEVTLSIDAELSEVMYDIIATSTEQAGFRSGAAAIMNVQTGELVAMTSFPSYDPEVMADGDDAELIQSYNDDVRFPFLNKVVGGVYTPGSIVKPFMAYAALAEDVISPDKTIVSNGELVLPNPYNPSNPTIFTDWRAHGKMTMREAIAYSSNVYFYIIGGGFGDQKGLGITKIHEYMTKFGLGERTGINLAHEQPGTVPNPQWKKEIFDDDWRLGDTYFTSIGQYGFQTTPLQMLRAYAAIANGGRLYTPHLEKGGVSEFIDLELNQEYLQIVHEGMRKTVNYPGGTARSFERDDVAIAAKSGTAEVGAGNAFVNSWAAGFFPYEEPEYAFILMMDRAPRANTLGATTIMGDVVEWMSVNRREMLGLEPIESTEE
ncbi:MAG: penicillin-binding protein 2 [Candidatus Azotimanducaceae bacterium]|jgi:penicillin-binding protein 2